VVGREFEPVRVGVRADETHVADRVLERAQTSHALRRIDTCQPVEATRKLLAGPRHDLVGHVIGPWQPEPTGARRHQEAALDARRRHPLEHLLEAHRRHRALRLDLAGKEAVLPVRTVRQCFRRPDVDDRVDRLDVRLVQFHR